MLFANVFVFRLTRSIEISSEDLESQLVRGRFVPCSGIRPSSFGWVSPLGSEDSPLVHSLNGCHLLCARREDKVVPSSALNEQVAERVARIEQVEGRKLTSQERQSLKDDALASLLPQALARSKQILGYISPGDQLLLVATASRIEAELFVNTLRMALGSLPVIPPPIRTNPADYYTRWLLQRKLPDHFSLGEQCDLVDIEEGSTVNCRRQDLATQEVRNHLESGKICTRLGLVWRGDLKFSVDRDLALRQLKFVDVVGELDDDDPIARLDAEFAHESLTFRQLLPDLFNALGGEAAFTEDDFSLEKADQSS
jgi:recombination associated protein RdgC